MPIWLMRFKGHSPVTHRCIVAGTEQVSTLQCAPTKTISVKFTITTLVCLRFSFVYRHSPLFLLSFELHIGSANPVQSWFARVSGPVEDIHISTDCLGSDQIGVLRHIAGTIDLVQVIDALDDSHACRRQWVVIAKFCEGKFQPGSLRSSSCCSVLTSSCFRIIGQHVDPLALVSRVLF